MEKSNKQMEEKKDMGSMMRMVVAEIEKQGIKIQDITFGDGYFIFDFGKDSVAHFTVKGLKQWLWGIWVYDQGDGNARVSLFGEHKDYIDKFKPTRTAVSFEFMLNENENDEMAKYKIMGFCEAIDWVRNHRLFMKYKYYDSPWNSIVKFTLSHFWHYRILKPISDFNESTFTRWWLKFAAWCYERRFRRRWNNFHVNVYTRDPGWHPRHEFQIVYEGMDEETIAEVYWKLRKEHKNKYGYNYDKLWLMTDGMHRNTGVTDAESDDDKRGFYFKRDSEQE